MWRMVLVVALAVGLAATASGAAAQTGGGTLRIGSVAAAVGETASVNVLARDVPAPGTGAYAIMIHFDPSVIQLVTCSVAHDSICQQPDDSTISIAAASPEGFTGEWVIAGIAFRCAGHGVSLVTLDIGSWGSAIPETATPQPAIENGAITCGDPTRGLVSIGQERGTVGQEVSIDLTENTQPPGLGAWTVDLQYDPSKIDPIRCVPYEGGVCSTVYSVDLERVTGASAEGLMGQHTLVTYVFRCLRQSASPLRLSINVFAGATHDPRPITLDIQNGLILCLDATPTPLPTSVALPPTGSESRHQPIVPWWPVALLAAGGAAVFGAAWTRSGR